MHIPVGYIDAHCHLSLAGNHAEMLLVAARARGIHGFVQGGIHPSDWLEQSQLATKYPDHSIRSAFGLHPWWVGAQNEAACVEGLNALREAAPRAAAIGELGLDLAMEGGKATLERQVLVFTQQLEIAQDLKKPLVLHVVKGHGRVIEGLLKVNAQWRGIVHGFNGGEDVARAYLRLGLTLSVGAGILGDGFGTLRKTLEALPLESWVIESEGPGLDQDPCRIIEVAQELGRILRVDPERVLRQSRERLIDLFWSESC